MAIYLQLVQLFVTFLYTISSVGAGDNLNAFDLGTDDMLTNLASAFLQGGDNSNGDCIFKCPNGVKPQKNPGHIAESNGCGAYGLKLDLSKLPNIEKCCTRHDICYGTCNKMQDKCDQSFNRCLNNVCEDLRDDMDLTDEEAEGCQMVAQLMYSTVQGLGCSAYLEGQKEACLCPTRSNKTRRKADNEL